MTRGRRVIDLRVRRFGRLRVIKRHNENGPRGDVHWVCRCDCGQKTIVSGRNLRFGNTKSCGCLHGPTRRVVLPRREKLTDEELANINFSFDTIEGVKLYNGQMSPEDFKKIQKAIGLTNAEMAEELGVSKGLVDNFRSGYRKITVSRQKHLFLLCREYGMVF